MFEFSSSTLRRPTGKIAPVETWSKTTPTPVVLDPVSPWFPVASIAPCTWRFLNVT